MERYDFVGPNMHMTSDEYTLYCIHQREREMSVNHMNKKIEGLFGRTPDELLTECGLADRIPLDLSVLLNKIGISALPMDFKPLEESEALREYVANRGHILGALVCTDESAAIFYNKNDIRDGHRYRFTIAHEIAHCCLTGEPNHIEFRHDSNSFDENERAANIFAGALLIPEKNLRMVIGDLFLPSVRTLADIFAVSENVMKARLSYLQISDRIAGYNY